ncbi:methyl-accepting chemotaxis protein [Sphingomonas sp. MMS24-J45]|uniref:methyl-accepting chemotaxis protein n=1 Tax=Sphingomonas sp. MMS24-J45 TaxID=3238806 RepID=UPI00384AE6F1
MPLDQSIKRAATVLLGMILLCGLTGIGATWVQSSALARQETSAVLLSNHELADMMHDAVRSDVLGMLQAADPDSGLKRDEISKDFDEHLKDLRAGIQADREYKGAPDVEAATSKLDAPMELYATAATAIIERAKVDPAAARKSLPQFFDQFRTLEVSMAEASEAITLNAKRSAESGRTIGVVAMIVLVLAMGLGAASTLGLIKLAVRHVVRPIETLSGTMRELGRGNLSAEVGGVERGDELGDMARAMLDFRNQLQTAEDAKHAQAQLIVDSLGSGLDALASGDLTAEVRAELHAPFTALKDNFNDAVVGLRALISSVTESAAMISTGSHEIARASEDLARRTEGNAASLEETSAAITQMNQRLQATAVAADSTVKRADGAMTTVAGGREITDEAVQAMTRVSESAKGIDSVIEGLDKIAFQTRVLAMNAAVEAGRAGDAGRGFAVVADLVSALAMRAEEEAGRARDQLTATQAEIGTAVERVLRVDGALADISSDVGEVHTLLAGIATDNQAQSTAITEISSAVSAMDQATQQNAAMVEQTSAAARNLTSEVAALSDQAARFKVAGQPRRSNAPIGSRAAPNASARAAPVLQTAGAGSDDWATF